MTACVLAGLGRAERGVPLAPRTTLGVGGPATLLLRAQGADEAVRAVTFARAEGLPVFVLGGGSNVVVSDRGLDGLVLGLAARRRRVEGAEDGSVLVTAEGGHDWDELVDWTVGGGLAGLECLSGIPGRVGAAPVQNIGAYGVEVASRFVAAEVLDLATGLVRTWTAADCAFAYRQSALKARGSSLVLAVTLRLHRGKTVVRYAELARALQARGQDPGQADCRAVRTEVLALRRAKGMLAEPEISRTGSVGSFFLNPEVGAETAREIASRLARPGQAMPRWELPGGGVKLSAAWLVEQSGLPRGWRRGRVGLSPHHALAIVNLGGASAAEIVELARTVQDRVLAACGLWLQPEPVLLGFGSGEGLTPTPPAGSSPGRVP